MMVYDECDLVCVLCVFVCVMLKMCLCVMCLIYCVMMYGLFCLYCSRVCVLRRCLCAYCVCARVFYV